MFCYLGRILQLGDLFQAIGGVFCDWERVLLLGACFAIGGVFCDWGRVQPIGGVFCDLGRVLKIGD